MCVSDFAALCWVMPRPVPKIAALLLITPACPLAIGWSFDQAGRRHDDETTSRLCLRSNAILIFLRDGKLEDMVTSWWQDWAWRECVCDSVCVREFRVWKTGSEWLGADVTFRLESFSDSGGWKQAIICSDIQHFNSYHSPVNKQIDSVFNSRFLCCLHAAFRASWATKALH